MMRKIVSLVIVLGILFYISMSLYCVRPFGAPMDKTYVGYYILNDAAKTTGAANVVTSVVFGYRGYDTLGEATIFFVAVLGFYWLISRMKGGENSDNSGE